MRGIPSGVQSARMVLANYPASRSSVPLTSNTPPTLPTAQIAACTAPNQASTTACATSPAAGPTGAAQKIGGVQSGSEGRSPAPQTTPAATGSTSFASLTLSVGAGTTPPNHQSATSQGGTPVNLPIGAGIKQTGFPTVSSYPNMSEGSTSERETARSSPKPKGEAEAPAVSSSPLSHVSRTNNNSLGLSSGGFSPVRHGTSHSHSRTPSRQGHARQGSAMYWAPLEKTLFDATDGQYNPNEVALKRRIPKNVPPNSTGATLICMRKP